MPTLLSRRSFITTLVAFPFIRTAHADTLVTGFTGGIEGPAWYDGALYAVNYARQGTIGRVTPDGAAEVFADLPDGSTGNGIRMGIDGGMYVADYTGHNVLRIDPDTRDITVFAHDPAWNQPNDLAVGRDGVIWASDPDWRGDSGRIIRVAPDGSHSIAATDIRLSNGIEVAPDEHTVYVSEAGAGTILAFDIAGESLVNRRVHAHVNGMGHLDGMRCDAEGWLYSATTGDDGALAVISPDGVLTETIPVGGSLRNLAFGGPDGRTAYVAVQYSENGSSAGRFETVRMERPGRSWGLFDGTVYAGAEERPVSCTITGNFPNPFNPVTSIEYRVAGRTHVRLEIFTVTGQRIRTLIDRTMSPGRHRVQWHGRDDRGMTVSSGVYLASLTADGTQATHRMTLVR